ncbi:hypothetical protein ASPWEDRAFT_580763 [Aspergillus wentii DTO 134E9]|uniref:Xylanolytic transcriptional activator regulatory domain-containing protein n=1 Tax=Aspergillus wentii DTO 134E9 TaxID=1073089 RepID=A0A1L9RHH2_ASPWE|nr:uncharacterized protein ASPWEDRAFT_580763 [Aspergillus wentii DTO 134E9]KAI9925725.1 hypothetical protein MW887_005527 [Aspergillus wentii]OJJ34389.1 hypothetical protein ASPWEDRAFT_580763 [Aspergillus wentii DTO 134E9]
MMASKRKLQDSEDDSLHKRSHSLGYDAQAPWLQDCRTSRGWRTLGNPAVQPSMPLSNLVSAVQDLIDPDFDPLIAILDDEPRFLKPLPSRIAPEDLEFLRFRGALSLPESGLRNELLRCYIQWVHSFMPVLNLQDFLRCIAENDPEGNVSILLFQAVMFVATAFVDLKHLQDAGYPTRKSARSAFYTRLRLLYSLDCEEDRIVILQTLLLMTYWSDHMNNPQRDIWDWIGVCNTQAHSIGLNRDPTTSDLDPRIKRLRIRLWWSLYSRDRLIAMGLRRPTQINEGTSSVPMLKIDDFDLEPFHPSVISLFRCRQLEDISHQKRLATMFIEKAKLCQCIGRVLFAQYTPSQCQFGTTTRTTITLVPRQASESELARCSQKLDSWLGGLPRDAQFIPASRNNFKDGEDVLLLHGAMLRMLYHATISALHRPWALGFNKDQSKPRLEWANTARAKMHDAATGITHIIQGLNQLNLTRFLPQSGVTVILPAAVAHLANTNSDNPAVRETSIHNFHRCIQVLHGLTDIYPAADMEVANIEAAVKVQSDSVGTFLKIMQYNPIAMNQDVPTSNSSPRKQSESSSHTIQPLKDTSDQRRQSNKPEDISIHPQNRTGSISYQTPIESHPRQQSAATHDGSQKIERERRPSNNDFDDQFNLQSPPATNGSPFLASDLVNLDVDPFPDFSPPEPHVASGCPELDIDWTDELLRGTELNSDYQHDSGVAEHRDIFSFPSRQEGDPIGRVNGDITGDLDRDLGLHDSDDIF